MGSKICTKSVTQVSKTCNNTCFLQDVLLSGLSSRWSTYYVPLSPAHLSSPSSSSAPNADSNRPGPSREDPPQVQGRRSGPTLRKRHSRRLNCVLLLADLAFIPFSSTPAFSLYLSVFLLNCNIYQNNRRLAPCQLWHWFDWPYTLNHSAPTL